MKIALAQYPITRHVNLSSWKKHIHTWVETAVKESAQVLVFPEYGSMELVSLLPAESQKSLPLQIQDLQMLLPGFLMTFNDLASKYDIAILAPSYPAIDERFKKPVNRAFFFYPEGRFDFQDKVHMTRFEDEIWGIGPGFPDQKVFKAFDVSFGVSICFDVEFPFAALELAAKGVQVLLAPSCTETVMGMNRVHVGARARALENQFYVAVSQTVGSAAWSEAVDINTGQAVCFSTCDVGFPDDGVLTLGKLNEPSWVYVDLDLSKIERVREAGQVFNFKNMKTHLK